jgi:hypothetical protein
MESKNKSTAQGCWTLDFFVSDTKLQITLDIQITRVTCLVVMDSPFDNEQVNLKLNTIVESVDPNLLTREDNSIQHFI